MPHRCPSPALFPAFPTCFPGAGSWWNILLLVRNIPHLRLPTPWSIHRLFPNLSCTFRAVSAQVLLKECPSCNTNGMRDWRQPHTHRCKPPPGNQLGHVRLQVPLQQNPIFPGLGVTTRGGGLREKRATRGGKDVVGGGSARGGSKPGGKRGGLIR